MNLSVIISLVLLALLNFVTDAYESDNFKSKKWYNLRSYGKFTGEWHYMSSDGERINFEVGFKWNKLPKQECRDSLVLRLLEKSWAGVDVVAKWNISSQSIENKLRKTARYSSYREFNRLYFDVGSESCKKSYFRSDFFEVLGRRIGYGYNDNDDDMFYQASGYSPYPAGY